MQAKLEARTDFESEVYNNPTHLKKAIKEHSLHFEENRHKIATMFEVLRDFALCRQKDKESLLEHTCKFKVARGVLNSHLDSEIILTKHVMSISGHDSNNQESYEKLVTKTDERLATYVHLINSD